jgi:hypothetical protein
MNLKHLSFILCLSGISFAEASSRNLCDDLIDSGTSSPEQIKRCLEDPRFGPSDYYKDQETLKKKKEQEANIEADKAAKTEKNIETKKFSEDELFDAGFGKPFYAIRGDYSNNQYKEKRITEGDALCSYLGYEKALASRISQELWENKNNTVKVDKQGLILPTNFFGMVSKTPEIFHNDEDKYTVRKYVELTCIRRKDKDLDGSKEAIETVTEQLSRMPDELNASQSPKFNEVDTSANNAPRSITEKNTDKTTPFGYRPPGSSKDSQTTGR